MTLVEGVSLVGRVLCDGRPVEALVRAVPEWPHFTTDSCVRSGPDGSFCFDNVAPGRYELREGSTAWGGGTLVEVEPVTASPGDRDIVLHLARAVPVRGVVESPERAVADLEIDVYRPSGPGDSGYLQCAESTARLGLFELGRLLRGSRCELRIRGTFVGGESIPTHVVPFRAGCDPVSVTLRPGRRIAGVVRSVDGAPIAQVDVTAARVVESRNANARLAPIVGAVGSAQTNDRGEFVISGLAEGTYELDVDAEGLVLMEDHLVGGGETRVELCVSSALGITGELVGAVADEIGAFSVVAQLPAGGVAARSGVDGEGRFTLRGLRAGKYRLYACVDSYWEADDRYALSEPIGAGATDVRLVLTQGMQVQARVVKSGGEQASGVTAMIVGESCLRTASVRDGRVIFRGLPPGRYRLAVAARTKAIVWTTGECVLDATEHPPSPIPEATLR